MSATGIVVLVIAALVVLVVVGVIVAFNRLVRQRNAVDNAWAQIDVQLKRRHELIPNLVSTVQGYAAHERSTLEAVTQARAVALAADGLSQRAEAETALSGRLNQLMAVAESYPDLKANQGFLQLQDQLADAENRIAYARQAYNDAVMAYNNVVQTVPTNVVAGLTGFRLRPLFQADAAESGPVQVTFPA